MQLQRQSRPGTGTGTFFRVREKAGDPHGNPLPPCGREGRPCHAIHQSAWLLLAATLLTACANPPGAAPANSLARIGQTQTLTLGFREDSKPFSFKGDDGAPAGYSVELCKRVAASVQSQLKLAKLDV